MAKSQANILKRFEDTALAASVRIPMSLPYMRDLGECTRSTKQLHLQGDLQRRSSKVMGIYFFNKKPLFTRLQREVK